MTMTYEVCDKCRKSIQEGTGAVVLKRTTDKAYPTMNLCEDCFRQVFPDPCTIEKGEGNDNS